jgi:class 3 adenylate cyclase
VIGEKLGGIAVYIGAKIRALAAPDEVLVSRTVSDLSRGRAADLRSAEFTA